MGLQWSQKALKEAKKLPKAIRDRIFAKMDWYAMQKDPLEFAETLTNFPAGSHRFRIGDYRVFCKIIGERISIILVTTVRKRDHAYN